MGAMPTKGAAEAVKERKVKYLVSVLQQEIHKVLASCILTEQYPATTIAFNFHIVELDSDLLQSMINCASVALFHSNLLCRCLPVAISMFLLNDRKAVKDSQVKWVLLDPNMTQIRSQH